MSGEMFANFPDANHLTAAARLASGLTPLLQILVRVVASTTARLQFANPNVLFLARLSGRVPPCFHPGLHGWLGWAWRWSSRRLGRRRRLIPPPRRKQQHRLSGPRPSIGPIGPSPGPLHPPFETRAGPWLTWTGSFSRQSSKRGCGQHRRPIQPCSPVAFTRI